MRSRSWRRPPRASPRSDGGDVTASLHVESVGAGPPLVLLHGWAMHGGLWGALPAELARRYRVHAVDLPGHGHSPMVKPYTLDAVVTAVAARFRGEPSALTVLGWSLGGLAAMRWALREPGRIGALVLVATSPRFVAGDDWPHAMARETLARFGDELRAAYRLTLLRFLTLQLRGSDEGEAALRLLRGHLFARGEPASGMLADALSILECTDLRGEVPAIAQRTLVVAGERDTLAPLAAGEWLAQAMPNARFAPIMGAAHAPFLSHPREFAAAMTEFDNAS
jgi:pimeloyl-[acyl-carrier protein] methyl ester esterase